jgi:hypothetical protein
MNMDRDVNALLPEQDGREGSGKFVTHMHVHRDLLKPMFHTGAV